MDCRPYLYTVVVTWLNVGAFHLMTKYVNEWDPVVADLDHIGPPDLGIRSTFPRFVIRSCPTWIVTLSILQSPPLSPLSRSRTREPIKCPLALSTLEISLPASLQELPKRSSITSGWQIASWTQHPSAPCLATPPFHHQECRCHRPAY